MADIDLHNLNQFVILAVVACAAFVASVINSVAGGGTFLTFPTLTGVARLSEKVANMTSTVGIVAGSASAVVAVRTEFKRIPRGRLILLALISLTGGTLGSLLLITTPSKTFVLVIPWLLLFATVVFAFSRPIARWAGHQHGKATPGWTFVVACIQFFVAVYGGYFGAGIGVLMLAGLAFLGLEDIHQMNALKVLLATLINGVASVIFVVWPIVTNAPDRIDWILAGAMVIASIIGGFSGARLARRIRQEQLRAIILAVGVGLTILYFFRAYGHAA